MSKFQRKLGLFEDGWINYLWSIGRFLSSLIRSDNRVSNSRKCSFSLAERQERASDSNFSAIFFPLWNNELPSSVWKIFFFLWSIGLNFLRTKFSCYILFIKPAMLFESVNINSASFTCEICPVGNSWSQRRAMYWSGVSPTVFTRFIKVLFNLFQHSLISWGNLWVCEWAVSPLIIK